MKKLPNIITQNRDFFYILSQEVLNEKPLAYVKTASASRQCRLFFGQIVIKFLFFQIPYTVIATMKIDELHFHSVRIVSKSNLPYKQHIFPLSVMHTISVV